MTPPRNALSNLHKSSPFISNFNRSPRRRPPSDRRSRRCGSPEGSPLRPVELDQCPLVVRGSRQSVIARDARGGGPPARASQRLPALLPPRSAEVASRCPSSRKTMAATSSLGSDGLTDGTMPRMGVSARTPNVRRTALAALVVRPHAAASIATANARWITRIRCRPPRGATAGPMRTAVSVHAVTVPAMSASVAVSVVTTYRGSSNSRARSTRVRKNAADSERASNPRRHCRPRARPAGPGGGVRDEPGDAIGGSRFRDEDVHLSAKMSRISPRYRPVTGPMTPNSRTCQKRSSTGRCG